MQYFVILVWVLSGVWVHHLGHCAWLLDIPDQKVIVHVWKECSVVKQATFNCLADKAARAVERATSWDLPIFDGITLKRTDDDMLSSNYLDESNSSPFTQGQGRSSYNAVFRLHKAVTRFLDTHTLTMNMQDVKTDVDTGYDSDDDLIVEGRAANEDTSIKPEGKRRPGRRRGRRLAYYVMMVLLGIYGISGPLIMKGLAMIAGKALIASKVALLLAGSIALKKLFNQEHHHSNIKVHANLQEEDHDRYYNVNTNTYAPYAYYQRSL